MPIGLNLVLNMVLSDHFNHKKSHKIMLKMLNTVNLVSLDEPKIWSKIK